MVHAKAKVFITIMSLAGDFLCDVCCKTFSKAWGLTLHKKIHLGLKNLHCLYCRKRFPDQTTLDEHKAKEHSNGEYSEQFRCEALEMVNEVGIEKAAEELMLHESTLRSWMTSEGQNYCSECHKSFRFQSHLKNHMKLHEGKAGKPVRTFKEKKFSEAFKRQVIEHAKQYSGKSAGQVFGLAESTVRAILKADSFPCNLCERKCAYRRQLERHLLEVHKVEQLIKPEEKPKKVTSYDCSLCQRKCAYNRQLERHMQKVHPVELPVKSEEKVNNENSSGVDGLEQLDQPNPGLEMFEQVYGDETFKHKDEQTKEINEIKQNILLGDTDTEEGLDLEEVALS